MGKKIGKISVIPKDTTGAFPTMDTSLRQHGFSRFPGTVKMMLPYQEAGGKYRTGLDEKAKHIENIPDKKEKERVQREIIELRQRLEEALGGIDLSAKSSFYSVKPKATPDGKWLNTPHVEPYSLKDGDNFFDLEDPMQHVTYLWIKNHPTIASSLEAYLAGEYPAETQFFVNDEDAAADIEYNKKKVVNDAVAKFSSYSVEKRKKIARLLGLPISEDTKETVVYNAVDNYLRDAEVRVQHFKGSDPVRVFSIYANLSDDQITIRDTLEKAILTQIYRIGKGGKIYEGEQMVFQSKDDMIDYFVDDKHQEDLIELEKKLALKRAQSV